MSMGVEEGIGGAWVCAVRDALCSRVLPFRVDLMAALLSLLDAEDAQRREAALALPHAFDKCTYELGHIRQAVYLCLTCALPRGICSACSIACHTDHEQVELFPKRDFQCDCPTTALPHPCSLVKGLDLPPNASNTYGQNFRNQFCRCGLPYDAKTERETMIQCLACEDWFHESCLNLRDRVSPATGTTPPREVLPTTEGDDDAQSVASDPDLPPALLARDDYDALICGACARDMPSLQRYAGTPNFLLVVRPDGPGPWTVLGREITSSTTSNAADPDATASALAGAGNTANVHSNAKRRLEGDDEVASSTKKARLDSESTAASLSAVADSNGTPPAAHCIAPRISPSIAAFFSGTATSTSPSPTCAGDIFLVEPWRSVLCTCSSCASHYPPYLLQDESETTYSPPPDPDVGMSLEALGLRALASGALPHAQAVEGARLFGVLRDDLASFLRPFAAEGREVREEDVRSFFERKREELRAHLDAMR